MSPFVIRKPSVPEVPIVLSIPHCGTEFPQEVKSDYKSNLISQPDDTDWFVHQLYSFASEIGITTIHAVYSRCTMMAESLPIVAQQLHFWGSQFIWMNENK
jgi:N-formylglutamate deformylase